MGTEQDINTLINKLNNLKTKFIMKQIKRFCCLLSLFTVIGLLTQSFSYSNKSAHFYTEGSQNDSITLELSADYELPTQDSDTYQMVNLRVVQEAKLSDQKVIRQYAPVKGLLFFTQSHKAVKMQCQLESLYTRTVDGEVIYIGYAVDLPSLRKNTRITLPITTCFRGTCHKWAH